MKLQVTASAYIKVPAEQVYAILANYHDGHPSILPRQYFTDLQIERGGIGTGTLVRFQMRVMGKTQTFRAEITEPVPGRVLVERNLPTGAVTTFTVAHRMGGQHSFVTISTELETRRGILGALERFLTQVTLRRIYVQELRLLAARAEIRFLAPSANAPKAIA